MIKVHFFAGNVWLEYPQITDQAYLSGKNFLELFQLCKNLIIILNRNGYRDIECNFS